MAGLSLRCRLRKDGGSSLVLQQVAAWKKQLDKEINLKAVRQTWRCTSRLVQIA